MGCWDEHMDCGPSPPPQNSCQERSRPCCLGCGFPSYRHPLRSKPHFVCKVERSEKELSGKWEVRTVTQLLRQLKKCFSVMVTTRFEWSLSLMEPEEIIQLSGEMESWAWAWAGIPPSFSQQVWCCKPPWWMCWSLMRVISRGHKEQVRHRRGPCHRADQTSCYSVRAVELVGDLHGGCGTAEEGATQSTWGSHPFPPLSTNLGLGHHP